MSQASTEAPCGRNLELLAGRGLERFSRQGPAKSHVKLDRFVATLLNSLVNFRKRKFGIGLQRKPDPLILDVDEDPVVMGRPIETLDISERPLDALGTERADDSADLDHEVVGPDRGRSGTSR